MKYNMGKMRKGLHKLKDKLSASDVMQIAIDEQCSDRTIRTYLAGMVSVPALGQAIINRAEYILNNALKPQSNDQPTNI